MMNAAGGVFGDKSSNRRILAKGFKQFNFCVGQFNKNNFDAMLGQALRLGDMSAQSIFIDSRSLLYALDGNGDMV